MNAGLSAYRDYISLKYNPNIASEISCKFDKNTVVKDRQKINF